MVGNDGSVKKEAMVGLGGGFRGNENGGRK
jgi:hypothetical protein